MKYCLLILWLPVLGMAGCGAYESAETTNAQNTDPQDNEIRSAQNKIYAAQTEADLDKLIEEFSEVIRLNPTDAVATFNRGRVYHQYRSNLASKYRSRDKYDKAVEDFTQAIRLDPNFAKAYQFRGIAHWYHGENDKAIADYTVAIRIKPVDVSYVHRGFAYAYKNQWDKSIADYNEAIRLNPDCGVAYYNRALANQRLGNQDKAQIEADFSKARELGFQD